MPAGALDYRDGLRMGAEVYHYLKQILKKDGLETAVGDEGGFAPDLKNTREVFCYLKRAVEAAGYRPGEDVVFAMDAAASELYEEKTGAYLFNGEADGTGKPLVRMTDEMIRLYEELVEEFPIVSIEDGLHEEDWEGWQKLTSGLAERFSLLGMICL